MRRARRGMVAGCAVLVMTVVGALWYHLHHEHEGTACTESAATVPATSRVGDVVLTDEPWDGEVSVHVGQRLVVVLANNGATYWTAPRVDGQAVGLSSVRGAYEFPCSRPPAPTEQIVLLAERPGTALVSSRTDAGCFHARPACAMPERQWQRTITVRATTALR